MKKGEEQLLAVQGTAAVRNLTCNYPSHPGINLTPSSLSLYFIGVFILLGFAMRVLFSQVPSPPFALT